MFVAKKTGSKFKNGQKINEVKEKTSNPFNGEDAYSFTDCDSIVSIKQLVEIPQHLIRFCRQCGMRHAADPQTHQEHHTCLSPSRQ